MINKITTQDDVCDSSGENANKINFETNTILIYDDIDEFLSMNIADGIDKLDNTTHGRTINVKINSVGGSMIDSQAIMSDLLHTNNSIHVDITNSAFSGAAMIALTGDYIEMSSLGMMMLHYPKWDTEAQCLKQHEADVSITKEWFERTMTILLDKRGLIFDDAFKALIKDEDTFFTPKDCLKYGLVDRVY